MPQPVYKELPHAKRLPDQPIITPRTGDAYWWEKKGTFNPGVAEYNGQVVLLYRAYDEFRISRLGIATSEDGMNFTRQNLPAIDTDPDDPYERLGIEDARITKIDETYYIVHTSSSYHPIGHRADVSSPKELSAIPWRVRLGLQTTQNFRTFQRYGVFLPDVPAKNGALLPEKINGRFAVYYRERDVLNLSFSSDLHRWQDTKTVSRPPAKLWQANKFGTGSPPILTDIGYLMVYHAVDNNGVYRLGLMMFDRRDPSRILWYSSPILEPEEVYEKEGFIPNVVYSCGAIIRGNELWIYYGAADRVIGRAVFPLDSLRS
ncbi:MAG: glycosidase [bacterium]|nr:glycosidase [bacterium]MDZ4347774.1 glycosidase [Candidatus Binatia bacterium]